MQNYRFCYRITNIVTSQPYVLIISHQLHPVHRIWTPYFCISSRPKADSYSRASRQLRPSPCIVRRLPSTIWRIMLKRTAIQYPSVHVSADEAWQYCSGIWTNHISLGRRVYDPSGRFLHLARFYQIISSKYPILSYLSIISTTLIKSALLSSDTIPLPAATIHRHFSNNTNTVIIIIIKWLLLLRYIINCISH